MWLPDYVLLLNHFGGRLITNHKTTLIKIPDISINHFLLISSRHLRSRARVTTCFLNLLISRAEEFDPRECLALVESRSVRFEPSVLGPLVQKIMCATELKKPDESHANLWRNVLKLLRANATNLDIQPLLKNIPIPRKMDPDFYQWGYAYPGIVLDPKKYLR